MWKEVLVTHNREIVPEECEKDFSSDLRSLTLKLSKSNPDIVIGSNLIGIFAKRIPS